MSGLVTRPEDVDASDRGDGQQRSYIVLRAETYARAPGFYGGTFCIGCKTHLPVGRAGEFVWDGTDERVGT